MAKKKPQKQHPQRLEGEMLFRIAAVDVTRVDREERSLDLVLATETPVKVFDFGRGKVVDEVLKVDGIELPANRQVPMVDSHNDWSVREVLGSIRELHTDGDKLVGRAFFADDPESRRTFSNYADGHLSDFSIRARRLETSFDEESEQLTVVRSEIIEGSAVIRGADPNAKAMPNSMRAYVDPESLEEEQMLNELREKLVARGLPKDASDEDAWAYLDRQFDNLEELMNKANDPPPAPPKSGDVSSELDSLRKELASLKGAKPDLDVEDLKRQIREEQEELLRSRDAEIKRRDDIAEMCKRHDATTEEQEKWIKEGTAADTVARVLLERRDTAGVPLGSSGIEFGASGREKFYEAVRSGIMARCGISRDRYIRNAERYESQCGQAWPDQDALRRAREDAEDVKQTAGSNVFRYTKLSDVARQFCTYAGIRTTGLPDHEIVRSAIGSGTFLQRASDGPAYHTTGSFSNLFLDAMNKVQRQSFDEAPQTYTRWVKQAQSTPDFKTLHRVIFGEMGMPEDVPENTEYPEATVSDSRENYQIQKKGAIFSISLEAIVNDDLQAMTSIPQKHGAAMRRKINRAVYSVLADNDALTADSIALFHATSHGANLDTTALGESALDTGYGVMATQTGLDSTTTLGLMPRFLIVPQGLAVTAFRLTNAGIVPETVSNVPLYGPNGPLSLEVVVDGQIDNVDSATAWYLAADNMVVDTLEITFLQGEESPVLERADGFTTDTIKYKIRQSWAVKAIDYRGLYQGNT